MVSVFDMNSSNFENSFEDFIKEIPNGKLLGIWVYSQEFYSLPEFGYKIHISLDSNNYKEVLGICLPYLIENKISFKMIASYLDLLSLNRGDYGYTQMGKAITVYPENIVALKKSYSNCIL